MWAFATMSVVPPDALIARAVHRFQELLQSYNPQGIANTVWAFAMLGYNPGALPPGRRHATTESVPGAETSGACWSRGGRDEGGGPDHRGHRL